MTDGPPIPNRQRRAIKLVIITLLAGAAALCAFGTHLIVEDYDGFVSWFDPVAAASCCAGITATVIALLLAEGRRRSVP
jgi:hypothetical protein